MNLAELWPFYSEFAKHPSDCSIAPLVGIFYFMNKIEVVFQMALKVSTTNRIWRLASPRHRHHLLSCTR
jgi:hypothetical protein